MNVRYQEVTIMNLKKFASPSQGQVIRHNALPSLVLFVLFMSVGQWAQAATNNWMKSSGVASGNWNDTTHWSLGADPGSAGHTGDNVNFPLINAGAGYTVTLADSMYPSGLTNRSLRIFGSLDDVRLNASGASPGSPLLWTFD